MTLFVSFALFLVAISLIPVVKMKKNKPLFRGQLETNVLYGGLCPENPPDTVAANMTVVMVGSKVVVNGIAYLYRKLITEKAVITLRTCTDSVDPHNCELFQTWKLGKEVCTMVGMKGQVWSDIFSSFHPPINKCKVEAGKYEIINGTLDAGAAKDLFGSILEKYFWRCQIDVYDYNKFTTCIMFGVKFFWSRGHS